MWYGLYYLLPIAIAAMTQYPAIAVAAVLAFVLRDRIPDPAAIFRSMGRAGRLKRDILANPANVTARRDLALVYLDLKRPGAAADVIEAAIQRNPENAELSFLKGLASFRAGRYEAALAPLVHAVELQPGISQGDPFLVAARALVELNKLDEALDAVERYLDLNQSSIEGYVTLSRIQRKRGDKKEAQRSLDEATSTWAQLPAFHKRKQRVWWMRSLVERLRATTGV